MAEYIEREAAIEALIQMHWHDADGYPIEDYDEKQKYAEDWINSIPAADVVPVVYGEWIEYPECLQYDGAYCDDDIVCSACGSVWNIVDNCTEYFDYCPQCGARMRGSNEQER